MVYGAPMSPGISPDDAAQRFWDNHGEVFRGNQPELVRRWAARGKSNSVTVIAYHQRLRGVPVEGANARIGVSNTGGLPRVIFASGHLAGEPTVGLEQPIIPAEVAAGLVQLQPGYGTLSVAGQPQLVVLPGNGERGDAWAWKVRTWNSDSDMGEPRTFYVDTALARILHVRQNWMHGCENDDVTGYVHGWATPLAGNLPDTPSNPPVLTLLPSIRVGWSEVGQGVWSDDHTTGGGLFWFFGLSPHTEVDIRSILGPTSAEQARHYFVVDNQTNCNLCGPGTAAEALVQAPVPGTTDLVFAGTDQTAVAQMNVVVHLDRVRKYITDRLDTDADLFPHTLRISVNNCSYPSQSTCNAGYHEESPSCAEDSKTLWFTVGSYNSHVVIGGCCRNTAYSSWIAHEYGHYALDSLLGHGGGGHGGFGEGFSDLLSHFVNDDPVFGREYRRYPASSCPGTPGTERDYRPDPLEPNCQYPIACSGTPPCAGNHLSFHSQGQVLSGIWQRILIGFRGEYGPELGLEKARQLHIDWMLVTQGNFVEQCQSAHYGTLLEVMIADSGGVGSSPHCEIICEAFAGHNIHCETAGLTCP